MHRPPPRWLGSLTAPAFLGILRTSGEKSLPAADGDRPGRIL